MRVWVLVGSRDSYKHQKGTTRHNVLFDILARHLTFFSASTSGVTFAKHHYCRGNLLSVRPARLAQKWQLLRWVLVFFFAVFSPVCPTCCDPSSPSSSLFLPPERDIRCFWAPPLSRRTCHTHSRTYTHARALTQRKGTWLDRWCCDGIEPEEKKMP